MGQLIICILMSISIAYFEYWLDFAIVETTFTKPLKAQAYFTKVEEQIFLQLTHIDIN